MTLTQKLRNMLDDLSWGGVNFADLNTELDQIEETLGLPITTPSHDIEGDIK